MQYEVQKYDSSNLLLFVWTDSSISRGFWHYEQAFLLQEYLSPPEDNNIPSSVIAGTG